MPFIQRLTHKVFDIDKFLNIDHRVGDQPICENNEADVQVVQKLLALGRAPTTKFAAPLPTGKIDATTCYFIYRIQARQHDAMATAKVDGIVSKAVVDSNYGGGFWTIQIMNNIAAVQNRAGWERLLAEFEKPKR